MEIIYHSDDMGATASITARLLKAWESGILQSFSVLANGDALETVKNSLQSHPELPARIVVHLNLSEGKPVQPVSSIPMLVDSDGYLSVGFLWCLLRHTVRSDSKRAEFLDQVEAEWRSQIEKVINLVKPRTVAAVDGHIHVHMLPFLFPVAVKLAKEYEIPEIRMSREPFYVAAIRELFSKDYLINVLKHIVLKTCAMSDSRVLSGMKCPDAMVGILYTGMLNERRVRSGIEAARRMGVARLEIAFHVGRATEDELGRWRGNREEAKFAMSANRDIEYSCLEKLRSES